MPANETEFTITDDGRCTAINGPSRLQIPTYMQKKGYFFSDVNRIAGRIRLDYAVHENENINENSFVGHIHGESSIG